MDNVVKEDFDDGSGAVTGVLVAAGIFILIHIILFVFGVSDVIKHCAADNRVLQILLLWFIPFYTIIYLFVRKTSCPNNRK